MDYFSPGFRELLRLARRAAARGGLFAARRNLRQAETQLGLLGWQQADFDAETQLQVDAIQNVEREQGALTNRGAELARALQNLADERAAVRAEFEQKRLVLEATRATAREPLAELDRLIGILRDRGPGVTRRSTELEKEERETNELYTKLIGAPEQTTEARDGLLRMRDRLMEISHERADLKAHLASAADDLQKREQERRVIEEKSAAIDREIKEARTAAEARDAEFAARVRELEKEKARTETAIQRLERGKIDPYREIGRVLADSGVAPVNQPEALARVVELRETILSREATIAASLAETATENPELLRVSLGLWGVLGVAFLLVLGALL